MTTTLPTTHIFRTPLDRDASREELQLASLKPKRNLQRNQSLMGFHGTAFVKTLWKFVLLSTFGGVQSRVKNLPNFLPASHVPECISWEHKS